MLTSKSHSSHSHKTNTYSLLATPSQRPSFPHQKIQQDLQQSQQSHLHIIQSHESHILMPKQANAAQLSSFIHRPRASDYSIQSKGMDSCLIEQEKNISIQDQVLLKLSNEEVSYQDELVENEKEEHLQSSKNRSTQKKSRKSRERKTRTTITREKLAAMNRIFAVYLKNKQQGKSQHELNLKDISNKLYLGYSTILHKFREFRANKLVKGGALISSLMKKRKYKKSIQLQQQIEKALEAKPFYTASQISEHIFNVSNKRYSRSIISRHLCQMGYSFKNLKTSPIQKKQPLFKEARKIYASIIYPMISNPKYVFLYIDELACSAHMFQRRRSKPTIKDIERDAAENYVSLLVATTGQAVITTTVKRGFFIQQEFIEALDASLNTLISEAIENDFFFDKICVVNDMNKIHLDPFEFPDCHKPIKTLLKNYNSCRYYLPPSSPHFNPIESMFSNLKAKLFKKQIQGPQELYNHMLISAEDLKQESVEPYFQDVEKCLKEELEAQSKLEDSRERAQSLEASQ